MQIETTFLGNKMGRNIYSNFQTNNIAALPGLADFYMLAVRTINSLPKRYKDLTATLLVKVENFPNKETLASLKIVDKYDLLGLYRGMPIPVKGSASSSVTLPDFIHLYRCPIIRYAIDNKEDLEHLIHHVMIHEIGHHFGFSESDISWIENHK